MSKNSLISAECIVPITPEALRLIHLAEFKEKVRLRKLAAARRALSLVNKLNPGATKARHTSRIFSAINKLRVAA